MTIDVKLSILFAGCLLISSFIFVAIMLHTIGSLSNTLSHFEEAFRMESELRGTHFLAMLKQNKMRLQNQMEHERRQEALLAIPLVRGNVAKPKP